MGASGNVFVEASAIEKSRGGPKMHEIFSEPGRGKEFRDLFAWDLSGRKSLYGKTLAKRALSSEGG